MISASEWQDVYAYAQVLLDRHPEARALIDEARRRADAALPIDLRNPRVWSWGQVDRSWTWARQVQDYRAAVSRAASFLTLGEVRAQVVHELVARDGYELRRPPTVPARSRGPAGRVASQIAADLTGHPSWGHGPRANRQSRLRYLWITRGSFKL